MEITVTWHDGKYPSFNVALATKAGNEPFLEIKGCRIVNGKNGEFVSPPSTKGNNDRYWNHAYFSKDFGAVLLEKAKESQPKEQQSQPAKQQTRTVDSGDGFESDIPFADPYRKTCSMWRCV